MSNERKKIYIYGAGNRGIEFYENIQALYAEKIYVEGFIDANKSGNLCGLPIYRITEVEKDSVIVVSVFQFEIALQIVVKLKSEGYTKVYWYNINNSRRERVDFFLEQCVDASEWVEETLFHVEMHAMDACNLNCVGCTHFSPIFEKKKPNTEMQLRDVELLRQKIMSIAQFHILGGEPFLNDEILFYVDKVKELYPKAGIIIVTNGLLIPKLPKEVLEYLAAENICVSISEYEPTHRMIGQIVDVLNEYNVMYYIREARNIFNIPLSVKPVEDVYCISNNGIIIANGRIARCPSLMYIEELNERFQFSFPTEGILDLSSSISGVELKRKLQEEVPLCHHCVKNEVEWSTCGSKVLAEYFVKK